jgi:hypothetical protein
MDVSDPVWARVAIFYSMCASEAGTSYFIDRAVQEEPAAACIPG